jgi:hypothetical protein
VFGADFVLMPFMEIKSELNTVFKKNKEMEFIFSFPIRIAFSLDKGGPYK